MKNLKLVVFAVMARAVFSVSGCGGSDDSSSVSGTVTAYAYAGTVHGQLNDAVFGSNIVTYDITINPDGYTHGVVKFGTTVVMSLEGTTTDDGNLTTTESGKVNDLGLHAAGPVVMEGTVLTAGGVVNSGSGHWYMYGSSGTWLSAPTP